MTIAKACFAISPGYKEPGPMGTLSIKAYQMTTSRPA
jgi:hypothetical protein